MAETAMAAKLVPTPCNDHLPDPGPILDSSQKLQDFRRQQNPISVRRNVPWTLCIEPKVGLLDFRIKELLNYQDLLLLFVRRDFVATYKQTILGPLWHLLHPLLTIVIFTVIFSGVAQIPTAGLPPAVFYLSGLCVWNYFAACLTKTSGTFINNASIFGKVYFPRLIVPLSNVISSLITFAIQFVLLIAVSLITGVSPVLGLNLLLLPLVLLGIALFGLGLGILASSMTTKYRDLAVLITFGVQLGMYATPIIYPFSFLSEKKQAILAFNPMVSLVEGFRFSIFGLGTLDPHWLLYSLGVSLAILALGALVFNQVERSFMDVV